MFYALLADLVVIAHLAFIVFVAAGGLLAWRWPWVVALHVPSLVWAVVTVTVGSTCPLTVLEKWLDGLAGRSRYEGGFVDRYLEGVVYPQAFTPHLRVLAATAVVAGYVALCRRIVPARSAR